MKHFESGGRFRLPEHPDRMVHGDLAFDDDGIRLQLTDPLRPPAALAAGVGGGSPQPVTEPIAQGRFRDGMEARRRIQTKPS